MSFLGNASVCTPENARDALNSNNGYHKGENPAYRMKCGVEVRDNEIIFKNIQVGYDYGVIDALRNLFFNKAYPLDLNFCKIYHSNSTPGNTTCSCKLAGSVLPGSYYDEDGANVVFEVQERNGSVHSVLENIWYNPGNNYKSWSCGDFEEYY